MPTPSSLALTLGLAACAASPQDPRPATSPSSQVTSDLPVLSTCTGAPTYPGSEGTAALRLRILGAHRMGDVLVQITPAGGLARELHSTLVVEKRWLRLGFDATLTGTLVDPRSPTPVGTLRFVKTVRDNDAAVPSTDAILRGLPLLDLTSPAGASIPYTLTCDPADPPSAIGT